MDYLIINSDTISSYDLKKTIITCTSKASQMEDGIIFKIIYLYFCASFIDIVYL